MTDSGLAEDSPGGTILVLNASDVETLLSLEECIESVQNAQITFSTGGVVMPVRLGLRTEPSGGLLVSMPASITTPASLGTKLVTLFPSNRDRGLPTILGAVLMFDPETGQLRALMDAVYLTGVRTAAASEVATRVLAREDATELALIGAGTQARTHLAAMLHVRPIRSVKVAARSLSSAVTFVEEARAAYPDVSFAACGTALEALEGAHVICTVSSSTEPVTSRPAIDEGSHINAVGSHSPTAREIDGITMRDARVVVDSRDANLSECGDCLLPIEEGLFGPDHVSDEIGEVLAGNKPGRTAKEQVTIYQSCGLAVQDVAVGELVYQSAIAQGAGRWVDV